MLGAEVELAVGAGTVRTIALVPRPHSGGHVVVYVVIGITVGTGVSVHPQ